MKKRILSLALASAMAVGTVSGAFAETEATTKTNVPYIQGNQSGEFMPNSDITRQEIAVMIGKALELEGSNPDFKDADKIAAWADEFVAGLQDAEIVEGDEAGNFNPTNKITRAELATMVVRAYESVTGEELSEGDTSFDDVADSAWYASAVKKAAEAGLVLGDGTGNFNPAGNATRAQTVVMVNRMLGLGEDNLPSNVAEVLETELNDSDEWPSWAVDAILVASTAFEYTVGEDGKIVIKGEEEELAVESVSAINGTITVVFREAPESVPTAADFTVSRSINGGESTSVAPSVSYDEATKTATLAVPEVAQTDAAQSVVFTVQYKEETAKTASFTVAAPTAPATVVAAGTTGTDTVFVFFSAPVDSVTGTDVGNYRVDRDNTVTTDAVVTPEEVELNTEAVGPYGVGQVATLTFPAGTLTAGEVGEVRVANVKSNNVVIPTTEVEYAAAPAAADATVAVITATTLTDGIAAPAATLSVNQGAKVTLASDPTDAANNVVGAEYRILNSSRTEVVGWTSMDAQNAPFDNVSESVRASIETSGLVVGTYTIEVRSTDAATNTSVPVAGAAATTATLTILPASGDITAPGAPTTTFVRYSNAAITTGTQQQAAKTVRVEGAVTDTSNLAGAPAGVAKVEYRVRSYNTTTGAYTTTTNWTNATATDGAFGGATENYNFVTPALTIGSSYIVEVRATDVYGNVGPIVAANDGVAPAVNGTADTATTPGLADPLAGTFTIASDSIAPVAGTIAARAGFTLGTALAPSNERDVDLDSTVNATDNSTISGVEFAVYKVNGVGSRELVRNFSSVGVEAVDGDFDSASEAYTIDYTLPNVSGEYVIEAVAVDAAGNRSPITANNTVTHVLDVVAPTATITPNTATANKFDFIVKFNEPVVKTGGGAIDATDFAIRNALGVEVRALSTSTLVATANPNEFLLTIVGADQAFVTAGNIVAIGEDTVGVVDITDPAGNDATGSYQVKSTDLE